MFWNNEFLDNSPSNIDVLLQLQTVELVDILFEEDLLQELKTNNANLGNFLTKPEIVLELVENITKLTEKDCSTKELFSRVHSAYLSCEILTSGVNEIFNALMEHPECLDKILTCLIDKEPSSAEKVTLVSKLINTIHSSSPDKLSCHITKDLTTFSKLVETLINNIDMSSSFEILFTFISKTNPPDMRFVFCEILSKLNFIFDLIDIMTSSKNEDKQRNACQLLCDIIVIGRSENADGNFVCDRTDFDMLSQTIQSREAVGAILKKIFTQEQPSPTTIVSGLKVLQTLIEKLAMLSSESISENLQILEEELEDYLIRLHDILKNPPKQEPIKTTFGVIERPLGYLRFEIVNFIKALIGTKSLKLMTRLVELDIIQVIIDLFFEFSWNNLIHTQVEQALKMFIELCSDKQLTCKLIKNTDLIPRLLSQIESIDSIESIGHIYKIFRHIKSIPMSEEPIVNYMEELKNIKPEIWKKWEEIPLVEEKTKNISEDNNNIDDIERKLDVLWLDNDEVDINEIFTRESVFPRINKDVIPKIRRPR